MASSFFVLKMTRTPMLLMKSKAAMSKVITLAQPSEIKFRILFSKSA